MASNSNINIKNKKAKYEFHFLETFTAGIQLTGTEIKSIRDAKVSIMEAYCFVRKGELFIKGMHIAEYDPGSYNNHDPLRERKLLLNRREIDKLKKKLKNKGLTVVPIRLYISESGYAKIDIALGQGKKMHDKRDSLKEKDVKRDIDRHTA